MIYLGYSPAGSSRITKKSGVAILRYEAGSVQFDVGYVSCVDAAMKWFSERLGRDEPASIGIDCPLYWETGKGGWRAADLWLRANYGNAKRLIISSNFTPGALLVQGIALGTMLRQAWPAIQLVETCPRLLYYAMVNTIPNWDAAAVEWAEAKIGLPSGSTISSQSEWSALVSAWVGRMGHSQTWRQDLRQRSHFAVEPAGPVSYWWPGADSKDRRRRYHWTRRYLQGKAAAARAMSSPARAMTGMPGSPGVPV